MTSDIWTSYKDDPYAYASATLHYIDSNRELRKKVLGFCLICHPHDGLNIYECITSVFKEYCITSVLKEYDKPLQPPTFPVQSPKKGFSKFYGFGSSFRRGFLHGFFVPLISRDILRL